MPVATAALSYEDLKRHPLGRNIVREIPNSYPLEFRLDRTPCEAVGGGSTDIVFADGDYNQVGVSKNGMHEMIASPKAGYVVVVRREVVGGALEHRVIKVIVRDRFASDGSNRITLMHVLKPYIHFD